MRQQLSSNTTAFCWKCGAEIPEGRNACITCFTPVYKPNLFRRLFNWLAGTAITQTIRGISFSSLPKIECAVSIEKTGKNINGSALQTTHHEFSVVKQTKVLTNDKNCSFVEQMSPAIQARMKVGEKVSLSLNELPADIRKRVQSLLLSGEMENIAETRTTYTFKDSSGKEQTYHSLDEMPPDVRSIYEQIQMGHFGSNE